MSLVNGRCSLRQRMDGEPHTQEHPNAQMHRKGDPSSPLHRKGDPNAYVHRKGDPSGHICEEGDSFKSLHAQAQSKAKTDPFATGHGLMSPSMPPTPRSPMSWRSVLSLQPLNPSHIPLDEWEILGKPSSRSHSQRSRSSSRGSSREGRRSSLMSAEFLGHSNSKQTSSDTKPSTQKLVKRRRGYWALNPMQWFRQCRNDKQVVDTSNLVSLIIGLMVLMLSKCATLPSPTLMGLMFMSFLTAHVHPSALQWYAHAALIKSAHMQRCIRTFAAIAHDILSDISS